MNSSHASSRVLWLQVWGLAAVQGAIALTWVIYNLYLLKLLTQFGFHKELATGLLVLENLLAAVMEPLMGGFSDRAQRWVGTRFPFISVGVILSSALFIAIPAFVAFNAPTTAMRWVLPVLLVSWALAMTVFRSPALSLLGRYAFGTNLPQAASILTLVGGLAGAMGPLANQFILNLGPARNGVLASAIAIALGGAFSLVSNGTIPFALSMVPPDKAGLGTGIYFSGGAVASSVFGTLFSQPQSLPPFVGALLAAVAFLAAGIFVATSSKLEALK